MNKVFPVLMLVLGFVVGSSVAVAYATLGIDLFGDVFIDGSLTVKDGTEGLGKVFTSDSAGTGSWQDPGPAATVKITRKISSSIVVFPGAPLILPSGIVGCNTGETFIGLEFIRNSQPLTIDSFNLNSEGIGFISIRNMGTILTQVQFITFCLQ